MKKTILLFTLYFLTSLTFGQSKIEIEYTSGKEVYLNGHKLEKSTSIDEIKNILGKPVIYKEYPTGKINYHYTEFGISVHTVNDKLLFIGVNLNWDGDKNFPENSFEGVLKIGDILIDKNSHDDFIVGVKADELFCPISAMCMTKNRDAKIAILIGFKEKSVTQVGFEFR